jgi:hypothetical protein
MRLRLVTLAILAAAQAASAQPPAQPSAVPTPSAKRDAIAEILAHGAPGDEDEPDTAGQPRTAPEPEPSTLPPGPAPRVYNAAPRSQLNAPVHIDDASKTPDSPLGLRDMAYDSRIRASFASAQSFQGPLDGGWMLSAGSQNLYALQLVDRRDRLEGVWRDIRRKGALNSSGMVGSLRREGAQLTLSFTPTPGGSTTVAVLHDGGNGQWTGELAEGGGRRPVVLRRTGP